MELQVALSHFLPVSLEEMNGIRLMNRTDTKFVTSQDKLASILQLASSEYRVQEVDGERVIAYRTVYLDTPQKDMYLAHQNGRRVREKIRVRTYVTSELTFLEVKNKDNKGRTDKKRIRVESVRSLQIDGAEEFLKKYAWYSLSELKPLLENNFRRITLVNKAMTERLTIDTDVCFRNLQTAEKAVLNGLIIIELKRDGRTFSPIREVLRNLHIKPVGISKYCVGMVLTSHTIKYNRFKQKMRTVGRIQGNGTLSM